MSADDVPPVGDLPSSEPNTLPIALLLLLALAVSLALALVSP